MPSWKKLITSGSAASLSSITTSGDITIPATNKIYLDGGSHTYIDEVASDHLRLVAGGTEILRGYSSGVIDIYGSNINRSIELGSNRTGDGASYIDFIGDTTYTDYGFRIIRNSGANGITQLLHRGTGEVQLTTQESAGIRFRTGGSDALMINSSQNVGLKATGKLFFDGVDSTGDTYIHEPSGNQIGLVTGGNTRVLVQAHKTYINSTGANGLVINNDEGTTTNSGRIFFEGNTTTALMQELDDFSIRTGATAGSSSGTERFRVNTSGASVTGDLDVSGALTLGTALAVAEGGTGATSLTSNAILTGNGTSAIQAESGLTFDGTLLHISKETSTTGTTGTTFLKLTNDVGIDLSQQKTFIDFAFLDDNTNETPQVRIGAEVGQNGDANSQEKEGSGAFVVYTNDADTTSG